MICQCGHGFAYHFGMVPVWPPGQPVTSWRCMECPCDERREAPEQLSMEGATP